MFIVFSVSRFNLSFSLVHLVSLSRCFALVFKYEAAEIVVKLCLIKTLVSLTMAFLP